MVARMALLEALGGGGSLVIAEIYDGEELGRSDPR
jgi:hypothetical protein